jgi:hypothetical protein
MAALDYTTAAIIKAQAKISDTNDDARLGAAATAVNELVESYIGRPVGDGGTAIRTFDVPESSARLRIRDGIRGITTLEYAGSSTDAAAGSYSTIASTAYVLRPLAHDRPSGWPALEVVLIDSPSYFPRGYATVRITPDSSNGWGWASIPPELSRVASVMGLRMFQASQSGDSLAIGTNEIGAAIIRFLPEPEFIAVLDRYRDVISPSWSG